MRFEEILPLMRHGAKATMINQDDGSYWMCGSHVHLDVHLPLLATIIKKNKEGKCIHDRNSWGIPRWAIMAEDWEILE